MRNSHRTNNRISKGLLVLVGVGHDDTEEDIAKVASRIVKLRLWPDDEGKQWKKNIKDIEGDVLCGAF